eukprot:scaffold15521_cov119-Cylindrotheca_fusiformis.AAC.6
MTPFLKIGDTEYQLNPSHPDSDVFNVQYEDSAIANNKDLSIDSHQRAINARSKTIQGFYIDQEENELPVEYKSFSTLDEASSFLKLSLGNNNDVDGGKVKESTSAQAGSSTSKIPVQHSSVSRKRRRLSTELENAEFNEMIKQLGECKDNGTAIKHNARLQGWIAKQRKEYQSYKCNAETTMTPKRIAELARHGFNFESKKKMTWDERAVQWLEYRSQTGNDPKRYSSDGLGKWVLDQRKKYKMLKNGEHTNLTEDQVSKLTEWGFTWDNKIKVPEVIVERRPWDHRFQDLIAFKESHGHTNVPQGTPGLWHWVRSQVGLLLVAMFLVSIA